MTLAIAPATEDDTILYFYSVQNQDTIDLKRMRSDYATFSGVIQADTYSTTRW